MNLNEKISKVKREVLEEQVKNGMAEETIKKMGLDIVDLRQAAGPTADLIAKLKEDIDKAKKGEDLLRRDLHQSRIQIKRLMGENIPEGQDEIFTLNKEVQCTLIGNSDDNNYTATNMNPKLPEDSQQSKQQKTPDLFPSLQTKDWQFYKSFVQYTTLQKKSYNNDHNYNKYN
jgi:hypothetical protein